MSFTEFMNEISPTTTPYELRKTKEKLKQDNKSKFMRNISLKGMSV